MSVQPASGSPPDDPHAEESVVEQPQELEHDGGPGLDPDLGEALYRLLYVGDHDSAKLDEELAKLERKHHDAVYSELIFLLSHLRFDLDEAKRHWSNIVQLRESMRKRLGTEVDLRVALVSYFVEVNRKLENPKIIELKLFEQTQASAYRDALTGLHNYRYFNERLEQELSRASRYNMPLTLVMIDVDNFKDYNDRNGHEAGNAVLVSIARLLSRSLRKLDVPTRYGGEEFALILPSTPKTGAVKVATRACEEIERHDFPNRASQPGGKLTVSMGIATFPADATTASELIRRADQAMYVAKASGKNQVQLYGQSRRSFRRVDAQMTGKFRTLSGKYRPLTTVRISEAGMMFLTDRKLSRNCLVNVVLKLPGSDQTIETAGRVVHSDRNREGDYETAIRFVEVAPADRKLLTDCIRDLERRG